MFEFDFNDTHKKNSTVESVPDPTALTPDEVAEIIRIAESHSLSNADRIKLLLIARNRKKRAYGQSSNN
jgi:hypothetical protein